jgi:hypothetical protein
MCFTTPAGHDLIRWDSHTHWEGPSYINLLKWVVMYNLLPGYVLLPLLSFFLQASNSKAILCSGNKSLSGLCFSQVVDRLAFGTRAKSDQEQSDQALALFKPVGEHAVHRITVVNWKTHQTQLP